MVIEKDKEYLPKNIEKKWQNVWKETKLYKTEDYVETKKKLVCIINVPIPIRRSSYRALVRLYTSRCTCTIHEIKRI